MLSDVSARPLRAVGRRKEAVARVILKETKKPYIMVNGKRYDDYFPVPRLQIEVRSPLETTGKTNLTVVAKVRGGGITGQAQAVKLGVARALLLLDPEARGLLKQKGFLSRDARVKERKKYGRKRARRGFQWTKR